MYSGIACIFAPIVGYIYFASKSPNRLQSEEFQIQQQEIQLRQGVEDVEVIRVIQEPISNPVLEKVISTEGAGQ